MAFNFSSSEGREIIREIFKAHRALSPLVPEFEEGSTVSNKLSEALDALTRIEEITWHLIAELEKEEESAELAELDKLIPR